MIRQDLDLRTQLRISYDEIGPVGLVEKCINRKINRSMEYFITNDKRSSMLYELKEQGSKVATILHVWDTSTLLYGSSSYI